MYFGKNLTLQKISEDHPYLLWDSLHVIRSMYYISKTFFQTSYHSFEATAHQFLPQVSSHREQVLLSSAGLGD